MSTLKQQGKKAFIWDLSGKLVNQGMGFVVSIFLARLLEPSDFGLIAMVMVIIGIAGVFKDVGLGGALIQRRKVHPVHYSSVFYFNVVVALFLSTVTYFSAPYISEFYDNELLLPLVQVMSVSFILGALGSVQSIKFRKELNYAVLTKIGLTSSLVSGVVGISLALYGAGVWSLVAQTLTASIMYNIIIWTAGHWKPTLAFSWKALTQLWGFGFRMFLVGLINAVYHRLDYLIIGKLFTPEILGFYQRAKSLNMMAVQYSSGSLTSVLFPILSKIQNDLPRFQNLIMKAFGIISFTTFLIFCNLYLVSEELIVTLFSEKWLQSVEYFKILIFSTFTHPMSSLLISVLSSRGNSKAYLRMVIYKKSVAFLNIGIGFLFGIEGFLYGLIVVSAFDISISIIMVSRELSIPMRKFYRLILVQMFLAAISLLMTLIAENFLVNIAIMSSLINVILFSMVYIYLNWILKTLSFQYTLEQFLPFVKKIIKNKKNFKSDGS